MAKRKIKEKKHILPMPVISEVRITVDCTDMLKELAKDKTLGGNWLAEAEAAVGNLSIFDEVDFSGHYNIVRMEDPGYQKTDEALHYLKECLENF